MVELSTIGNLSKWILLTLNTALLLVGIATLSRGFWLGFNHDAGSLACAGHTTDSVSTVLIAWGTVLLAVVAFGDFHTHKGNRAELDVYTYLLLLLAWNLVVVWNEHGEIIPTCHAVIPSAVERKALAVKGVFFGTLVSLVTAATCAAILVRKHAARH